MKIDYIINGFMRPVVVMLLLINIVGCNDTIIEDPEQQIVIGDTFTVTGSMTIPNMPQLMTRSAFDASVGEKTGADLKLTVFEFDLGSDAAHSFLSNIYKAEIEGGTDVANGGKVKFNLTLKAATTPKVLHFMVTDKYLTSQFGSIASILPTLTVGEATKDNGGLVTAFNEQEAYWGYVELPNGYVKKDNNSNPILDASGNVQIIDGDDGVKAKLTDVPVVRNFAQISVELDKSVDNFELLGFDIVNVPTAGTIAPWNQNTMSVPDLLDGNTMKPYSDISRDPDSTDNIDEAYDGIIPAQTQFRNVEAEAKKWTATSGNMLSTASRYIYEHPYESTRRSYLIVHGIFTETVQTTGETKRTNCFYKLDIGKSDGSNNNMFQQYNILRNIHYKVIINKVDAVGSTSVEAAVDRAPFNNLSAATETESMLNISNGTNLLIVNNTSYVIVSDNQTVDILYRYRININGSSPENKNEIPHVIIGPGEVIKRVDEENSGDYIENGISWKKVALIINNPTSIVKTQNVTIVDDDGLGRIIELVLRNPWEYSPIYKENGEEYYATVAQGTKNQYDLDNPMPEEINSASGTPLTVYFNLPDGLPPTMFPLTFQIESKKQWIENNKIGTLVVSTGPSLFDPEVTAISFIKTVSYEEYIYNYFEDPEHINDLDVTSTNTHHTIRCRFLTIGEEVGEAEIGIHNSYFTPTLNVVKFTRGASEMN